MKLIPLDSLPRPKNATYIVDLRVILFLNLSAYRHGCGELLWQQIFNSMKGSLLVVDDKKDYWRTSWLKKHRPDLPGYKDGRLPKTPEYYEFYDSAINYIKASGIDYFCKAGYEADDWAGLAYRLQKKAKRKKPLILVTTDADWWQLCSDPLKIMIECPGRWKQHSKLLDEAEVIYKYGMTPRAIVEDKMINGDVGDNIVPGTPREIIDLVLTPPIDFSETESETFSQAIQQPSFIPIKQLALQAALKLNERLF